MAWYPQAVKRPVTRFNPGGSLAQRITPRRFVFHTAVSNSPTLWPYFNQSGNPCSHFYVNETGVLEQYVDTAYRAPANLEGNHDCISVESWDGAQSPVPPWNAAQVAALRDLVAWVSATHGIPRSLLPSSQNGLTGFGWHRQGIDPWRLPSTEYWSKSTGKICPGDAKIAQIPGILQSATEDDVTEEEHNWLSALHFAAVPSDGSSNRGEISTRLREINTDVNGLPTAAQIATEVVSQLGATGSTLTPQQVTDACVAALGSVQWPGTAY